MPNASSPNHLTGDPLESVALESVTALLGRDDSLARVLILGDFLEKVCLPL